MQNVESTYFEKSVWIIYWWSPYKCWRTINYIIMLFIYFSSALIRLQEIHTENQKSIHLPILFHWPWGYFTFHVYASFKIHNSEFGLSYGKCARRLSLCLSMSGSSMATEMQISDRWPPFWGVKVFIYLSMDGVTSRVYDISTSAMNLLPPPHINKGTIACVYFTSPAINDVRYNYRNHPYVQFLDWHILIPVFRNKVSISTPIAFHTYYYALFLINSYSVYWWHIIFNTVYFELSKWSISMHCIWLG